ncbi:DUF4825 domain-containing protein [Arcanobacterium phocae]|uniref:DUF4825 domain-containing protein n=1 Tax=Arcanobacterium phocae TaxID=131112 RepID=UPI001C0EF3D8|nr:DUF4825 domain-containing protein [Arcanobacterium phocae]
MAKRDKHFSVYGSQRKGGILTSMRVGFSHWRTIASLVIVVIIVSAAFWGVYRLVSSKQFRMDSEPKSSLSYRTHNIADSRIYVSDYIGDQANTFALMRTLPLNDRIVNIGIADQGININLRKTNLTEEDVQRDALYSASVVMAVIKDAKYVSFRSGMSLIEVTRFDVESFIPEGALTTTKQQVWDRVRRAIPEAVPQLIEVRNTAAVLRPSSQ